MLPRKPLLAGIVLLLLALGGFAYNATRPAPPVRTSPLEELAKAAVASPTPAPESTPSHTLQRTEFVARVMSAARYYQPPAIKLVTPAMAAQFGVPSSVPIEAKVVAGDSQASKVEFFAMEAGPLATNLSWSGSQLAAPGAQRLGEAVARPYKIVWQNVDQGQYLLVAVVTDRNGVRRASRPALIVVGTQQMDSPGKTRASRLVKTSSVAGLDATGHAASSTLSNATRRVLDNKRVGKHFGPALARYPACPDVSEEINFRTSLEPDTSKAANILDPATHRFVVLSYLPVTDSFQPDPDIQIARYLLPRRIPESAAHAINFCPLNPKDPWNTPLQVRLQTETSGVLGNAPRYTYYSIGGKITGDGETALWDLSGAPAGVYTAVVEVDDGCENIAVAAAKVKVLNYCTQECLTFSCPKQRTNGSKRSLTFHVNLEPWAIKDQPIFDWQVSQGTIVNGQGTDSIEVDTSQLSEGMVVSAVVKVSGLYSTCNNAASLNMRVGAECYEVSTVVDNPPPPKTLAPFHIADRNKTGPKEFQQTVLAPVAEGPPGGEEHSLIPTEHAGSKEVERIQLKWPATMEVERSASITVAFDRTTESVTSTVGPGTVVERLDPSGKLGLLKDRYGAEYEAFARAVLDAPNFECKSCGHELFQSLDREKVQWSWNVSPDKSGAQTFNVSLIVEWRHRTNGTKKEPETLWSRNDNPIIVTRPLLTRSTILVSSGLFCFVGVGFVGGSFYRRLRALKAAPTVIVEGDVIMGNKGDSYNISGGQIGAVGPDAHVHDVKFNNSDKRGNDGG